MKDFDSVAATKDIIHSIKEDKKLKEYLLDHPLPHPYCYDFKYVKAFVLGTDPSNFSDNGTPVVLDTVFAIGSGDPRYFRDILNNLKCIGLNLENIYVQNLVRNYMTFETSKNLPLWHEFASKWIEIVKQELHAIDPKAQIPALITAETIYDFLLVDKREKCKAIAFYDCKTVIPIEKTTNKLERPIIPLYRHPTYKLTSNRWNEYLSRLKTIFNTI